MASRYTIGLDFGTNSMRALIVDVRDGKEIASFVSDYASGDTGVIVDPNLPDLARQHPADYLAAIESGIRQALKDAAKTDGFSPRQIIGIGVDTTGSTPMPVDSRCRALACLPEFAADPDAMAWLWKDHTSHREAAEITAAAGKMRPALLAKCGQRYSSEWFWAKIWRCLRVSPRVFSAAATWVEIADWIPAVLAGVSDSSKIVRGVCAAGHKAFFNPNWGGYPDEQFIASLDPQLVRVRRSLPDKAYNVATPAGRLSAEWAKKLGLAEGLPIAVGAFDAHLGAIGAGIEDGTLVKIIGTSTCDIMVSPMDRPLVDIPGLCGIVPESVLPGYYGLEAGQSAVGDIFKWLVSRIEPGGTAAGSHEHLSGLASHIRPGESGLLCLDWHNGNRTVLVDQRLTGLLVGLNLQTSPAEIYRALIEATAMGARVIMERFEEYGVPVRRIVNCGGISARNPLVMQIYADVMNRPIAISRSLQTCALGSTVAAAVMAGKTAGGYDDFPAAIKAMTGVQDRIFTPDKNAAAVYEKLFAIYKRLHDAFGVAGHTGDLSGVMKELLDIRDSIRGQHA